MLQFASVTGLLRTVLIVLLVYFGFRILSRLLAPFLFKQVAKKAEKRFGQQFDNYKNDKPPVKEGETIIDKIPKTKSSNKDVGDYVDFEEID